jgi:hypothetical protein
LKTKDIIETVLIRSDFFSTTRFFWDRMQIRMIQNHPTRSDRSADSNSIRCGSLWSSFAIGSTAFDSPCGRSQKIQIRHDIIRYYSDPVISIRAQKSVQWLETERMPWLLEITCPNWDRKVSERTAECLDRSSSTSHSELYHSKWSWVSQSELAIRWIYMWDFRARWL